MESEPEIVFYEEIEGSLSEKTEELLVAKDYHDVDNKQRVDKSAHTLTSKEDLPGFRYDEDIYVREDFRNMISQVIKTMINS